MEELQSKLAQLELDYSRIDSERMRIELRLRDKECMLVNAIRAAKRDLQKLQNEDGSNIILEDQDEKDLRAGLRSIDQILRGNQDESRVILSFEAPSPSDKKYSIHLDLCVKWGETAFHITIKTKCAAVEKIVRETISEYRNMTQTTVGLPEELCRKWSCSRHNEYSIMFHHKAEET